MQLIRMEKYKIFKIIGLCAFVAISSCKIPALLPEKSIKPVPSAYNNSVDSTNSADIKWKDFFADSNLIALIDTAINNNLEVLMSLQDIEVAKSNILFRKGLLRPTVSVGGGLGIDKTARFTATGAGNASTEITEGVIVPEPLTDMSLGFRASWEIDVWHKLRTAKNAAFTKYLKSVQGRNYVVTNLVAEIANSYYELLALDNQLAIIKEAIQLQQNELEVVKIQKEAARATELAVKQFEAQVYNSQGLEFDIQQQIIVIENRINFLLARYPQKIVRDTSTLTLKTPMLVNQGIPSQLLQNRPDIRQAELELAASKLDVQVARLEFYPSVGISASFGYQAFNPKYLFRPIESLASALVGDIAGPIINRRGIQAEFNKANAYQLQALYDYQKLILNGYVEVYNEMASIKNLEQLHQTKSKEAETLTTSISIAKDLFKSARANYLEVLVVQRDALAAKLDLIEIRKRQFNAVTNVYRALGGGWK